MAYNLTARQRAASMGFAMSSARQQLPTKITTYNPDKGHDPIIFKQYQILSEDARCNLSFLMDNVSKYDHIACRAYLSLIKLLTNNNTVRVCINLKHPSTWNHILGIAATCKHFEIPLFVLVDKTNYQLTITQIFVLYCLQNMGAQFVQEFKHTPLTVIKDEDLSQTLHNFVEEFVEMMYITFANHNIKPDYIVVPAETSIFSRNDFYEVLMQKCTQCTIVPVIETESDSQYIFQSWVQTMSQKCSYREFFYTMDHKNRGGIYGEDLAELFENLPATFFKDIKFDGYDTLHKALFKEMNARFALKNKYSEQLVKVTKEENNETFKIFLNTTHSIATGMFTAPLTAVLKYRFMFKPTDQVVCYISGAILTDHRAQHFAQYLDNQINTSLKLNNDMVKITINYNTSRMSDTIKIFEIFKQKGLSINDSQFYNTCVVIQSKGPGYDAIIETKELIENAVAKSTVVLDFIGQIHPNMPKKVDYSQEQHVDADPYESVIKSFDDITPQSIAGAYRSLCDLNAVDESIMFRDKIYSKELGYNVILQMENMQQTGSFKIRGASNMLIKAYNFYKEKGQTIKGVVACSAGNHAQGVAKTANLLGIKCTIVCPESAPFTKLYNTLRYNAEVIKHGAVFDAANEFAQKLAAERGWIFVPPYNHYDVMEGQGTIAHELL